MKEVILRISVRLTDKDLDLLWLEADKLGPRFPTLVKRTIRTMLREEQFVITLPNVPAKELKAKTFTLKCYKGEDEEIAEWLQRIQEGKRGTVIKGLLRYVMEAFDMRPYMAYSLNDANATTSRRATLNDTPDQINAVARVGTVVPQKVPKYVERPRPQQPITHLPETETKAAEDGENKEESWFSAFINMADQ